MAAFDDACHSVTCGQTAQKYRSKKDKAANTSGMSQLPLSLLSEKDRTDFHKFLRNCIAVLQGFAGIKLLRAAVHKA